MVVGGHTHSAVDRRVGAVRALNPGSSGIPKSPGEASWLVLDFGDRPACPGDPAPAAASLRAEHRTVPFDVDAVVRDLQARLHPNAEFLAAVLTGKRRQYRNGR